MARKPFFHAPLRHSAVMHRRTRRQLQRWPAPVRGMLWMVAGGLCFSFLNTLARVLSQQLDVYQAQFLRYLLGLIVMLPLLWRHGLQAYRPVNVAGQFWRGAVHTLGLILWFTAPKPWIMPLACGLMASVAIWLWRRPEPRSETLLPPGEGGA